MRESFKILKEQMLLRLGLPEEREGREILCVLRAINDDLLEKSRINVKLAERSHFLTVAMKAANTRANKYACLALLGFGLIAIEVQAVALYFLPR